MGDLAHVEVGSLEASRDNPWGREAVEYPLEWLLRPSVLAACGAENEDLTRSRNATSEPFQVDMDVEDERKASSSASLRNYAPIGGKEYAFCECYHARVAIDAIRSATTARLAGTAIL